MDCPHYSHTLRKLEESATDAISRPRHKQVLGKAKQTIKPPHYS